MTKIEQLAALKNDPEIIKYMEGEGFKQQLKEERDRRAKARQRVDRPEWLPEPELGPEIELGQN